MNNKKFNYRLLLQIIFFLLIGTIAINHYFSENGKALIPFLSDASLHALCPFGGVATFYSLVSAGILIKKIHLSSVVLMTIVIIISLLFGAVFCGWVCPMGTIQEWFGKMGKKIFNKKYNKFIPEKVDKYLKYIRYISLVMVLYLTANSMKIIFADIDPYYALFNFWTGEVALLSILVLITTLLASLFIERPWCKYFCPYGALLGLFNKISLFKIRVNNGNCINCSKCNTVCPMNIKVNSMDKVNDVRCIGCMECTSEINCPIEDTVTFGLKSGGEKYET